MKLTDIMRVAREAKRQIAEGEVRRKAANPPHADAEHLEALRVHSLTSAKLLERMLGASDATLEQIEALLPLAGRRP